MAVTAQTESNNTENVFWVRGRVPKFTFDMNTKSSIFAHFGVISLLYLVVCMYISYKAHNRFTKETLLIVSDVDVYLFLHWGVYPLALRTWIWEVAFWTVTKCDSHKLRQFRNPCRRFLWLGLSHFVIMAVTAQIESNNTENVFLVLGRVPWFTFDMDMKNCIFAHFGVISLVYLFVCMYISYKVHNQFTKETLLVVTTSICTCLLHWRVEYPFALRTWIWEVAIWTVTKCDSHKLRQFRNPCRRILWFVAFCDHCRDGTNWVQ